MKKDSYLFFCHQCGVPQRITEYIITHYLFKKSVDGVYCGNCKTLNRLTNEDRTDLFRKL